MNHATDGLRLDINLIKGAGAHQRVVNVSVTGLEIMCTKEKLSAMADLLVDRIGLAIETMEVSEICAP